MRYVPFWCIQAVKRLNGGWLFDGARIICRCRPPTRMLGGTAGIIFLGAGCGRAKRQVQVGSLAASLPPVPPLRLHCSSLLPSSAQSSPHPSRLPSKPWPVRSRPLLFSRWLSLQVSAVAATLACFGIRLASRSVPPQPESICTSSTPYTLTQ